MWNQYTQELTQPPAQGHAYSVDVSCCYTDTGGSHPLPKFPEEG